MRLLLFCVAAATMFALGYGQNPCGKADIIIALDTNVPFINLTLTKVLVDKFLQKVMVNEAITPTPANASMVSLIAYGVANYLLSPFTTKLSEIQKGLTIPLPPSPQRMTDSVIDMITEQFRMMNRPGVPRIAIIFVSGLTDGDLRSLKDKARNATDRHNILFLAVSSNKMANIRDLDIITNYVKSRIVTVKLDKPQDLDVGVVDLEHQLCRYMENVPTQFRNCTGKAHIVVGIDLQSESLFKKALDFSSILFWNVRQIRRTLVLNDASQYETSFTKGNDSSQEFGKLYGTSYINNGNYDVKNLINRMTKAYDVLPTSIHTVRLAILITDQEPSSATEMIQMSALLQSKNIQVIVLSIRDNFLYLDSKFLTLTDIGLENHIVVTENTLLGSGMNQMMDALCNSVEKCPGEIDLVIAMDSSYSISNEQFQDVKEYTKIVQNSFINNKVHAMQSATLAFGENATLVAFYGDTTREMFENINNFFQDPIILDFKTNIDHALTNSTAMLLRFGREHVTKVIITVTDGKSTSGITKLQNAARDAADKNILSLAVGIGTGYVDKELRSMTNWMTDSIFKTDFSKLVSVTAKDTVDKLCRLAIEGTITDEVCNGRSQVSIAIDVNNINFPAAKQFVHNLVSHLGTDVMITIVIGSTGNIINFPAFTDRSSILQLTNADEFSHNHVATIQRLESTFSRRATMPRIGLLITDGKFNVAASTVAARVASLKDIQLLALGITNNNPAFVDMNELKGIAGGLYKHRFVVSDEGLQTSGLNQVTSALCNAISDWTGTALMRFPGPAEISVVFDACDQTKYSFYHAFTSNVLEYVKVEDNDVKFSAASFCNQVEPMTSYQDLYYVHPSLHYENIMTRKSWTASQIIGDYITYFGNIRSGNKFGIVIVNDASYEPYLDMISKVAFQQGITLLALGIKSGMGLDSQIQAKLNMINKEKNFMTSLTGMSVEGITFLTTNIHTTDDIGDRNVAIGLVGQNQAALIDQYTYYSHVVTELKSRAQAFQGDMRLKMNNDINNAAFAENGLAVHDAIASIRQQFYGVTGEKYAFIVASGPAEYPRLVAQQRKLAEKENITIIAIGYRPAVTPDQLVDIAGNVNNTWFYIQSNQISTQSVAKFFQLLSRWEKDGITNPKLAFAISGTGISDDDFDLVRHMVANGVQLYKQLESRLGASANIQMSAGILGYDGFYPSFGLTDVQAIDGTFVLNKLNILQNEALAHTLMNMYLTLQKQQIAGRPQYAALFYNGNISNIGDAKYITDMMRASGITFVPYHLGGNDVTSKQYQDAFVLAGNNSANVNWISKATIDQNGVDHNAIAAYLRNNIMNMDTGAHKGYQDLLMVHAGNLGTISLSSTRKIIQAVIGTSQQYQPNLKIGVSEFDGNTLSQLINFGYHVDFNLLLDALEADTSIRSQLPRPDNALDFIIKLLTQNKTSDVLKAAAVVLNDEAFSKYITSGLAYQAYANGIYILPIRVTDQGSTLTQQDMTDMAYGFAENTFTGDDITRLKNDALVWFIDRLNSLTPLVPSLTTPTASTATTTTTTTTTLPTTTFMPINTTECVGPADLIFAIDGSDSLSNTDFIQSKEFVMSFIKNINKTSIDESTIRIRSVYSFSADITNIFDDLPNKGLMMTLLQKAVRTRLTTRTDLAIQQAISRLSRPPQIASHPLYAVIMTDGKSIKPQETLEKAMLANAMGITVFAIGIRNPQYLEDEWNTMKDELLRIANNVTEHVLIASNFSELMSKLPELNALVCNFATTTSITTTTTTIAPTTTPMFSSYCASRCSSTAVQCLVPHPTNCKMYLECIREHGATYFFNYNIKECNLHYFWNPAKQECEHLDEFVCAADPCVINGSPNGTTFAIPNTCNKYYKCLYTPDKTLVHARQACQCEFMTKYDAVTGHCVGDPNNDCSPIDFDYTTPKLFRCVKTAGSLPNTYVMEGQEKYCPVGHVFKTEKCRCDWGTFTTTTQPTSQGCSPLIKFNFATMQANYYQLHGDIVLGNGEAYLGGQSHISNPQLSNNIAAPFIVNMVIKLDSQVTITWEKVTILESCINDPIAALEMYIERKTSRLVTTVKLRNPSSLTPTTYILYNTMIQFFDNEEVTVTFGFSGKVIAVDTAYGGVRDHQTVNLPGISDFLGSCSKGLNFGTESPNKKPFVGFLSKWEVFNRCNDIPPQFIDLFTP